MRKIECFHSRPVGQRVCDPCVIGRRKHHLQNAADLIQVIRTHVLHRHCEMMDFVDLEQHVPLFRESRQNSGMAPDSLRPNHLLATAESQDLAIELSAVVLAGPGQSQTDDQQVRSCFQAGHLAAGECR